MARKRTASTTLVLCAACGTLGFESYVNLDGHYAISHKALTQVVLSSEHGLLGFTDAAIGTIATNTQLPDHPFHAYAEHYHFDNEALEDSAEKIVVERAAILDLAREGNQAIAWDYLSSALHTIEDFYSHSTWVENVERGLAQGTANHSDVDAFRRQWFHAGAQAPGCDAEGSQPFNTPNITTTYYEKIHLSGPPYLIAGVSKCVHGGLTTNWEATLVGGRRADKDSSGERNHEAAKALAVTAATDFTQGIINELGRSGKAEDLRAACVLLGHVPYKCGDLAGDIRVFLVSAVTAIGHANSTFSSYVRHDDGTVTTDSGQGAFVRVDGIIGPNSFVICREGETWVGKRFLHRVKDQNGEDSVTFFYSLDDLGVLTAAKDDLPDSGNTWLASHLSVTMSLVNGWFHAKQSLDTGRIEPITGVRRRTRTNSEIPLLFEPGENEGASVTMTLAKTLPAGSPMPAYCTSQAAYTP